MPHAGTLVLPPQTVLLRPGAPSHTHINCVLHATHRHLGAASANGAAAPGSHLTHAFQLHAVCRDLGAASAEVLAQLRYDLPATMKFHK